MSGNELAPECCFSGLIAPAGTAMAQIRAEQGDITRAKADIIVNAANASLLGGCPTGEARITGTYDLPHLHVIHTVGPVWRGGGQGEAELLASVHD
jgi:O-acetyl-ADP-ribose deacetylase